MKKNLGFTLVELMLVIGIIGILSTFTVLSLQSLKGKSRDARRIRDMQVISLALQLYYEDNGHYPEEVRDIVGGEVPPNVNRWESSQNPTFLNELVLGGYLTEVPKDPLNSCENCNFTERRKPEYENYIYDYQRRSVDPDGPQNRDWYCSGISDQDMFVLGIRTMETIPRPPAGTNDHLENHPSSPGFDCNIGDNFNLRFDWVTSSLPRG